MSSRSPEFSDRTTTEYCITEYRTTEPKNIPQKNHSGNTEGVKLLRKRSVKIPIDVKIPIGNSSQHHRYVRQADLCAFPTSLATAELQCRIYPSSVACIQRCALGYTLKNGTEMKRWCMKNRNRWYPHGFQECRPYVDCGVTLISGGKEECSTPTVKEPVSCRITCDHFENEAGGQSTHECDINGKWTPKLPYCARPGSDHGKYLNTPTKPVAKKHGRPVQITGS
ncbi:uncharacterized protein CEXT_498131 [Caerostris extrusa]|uniref:Sushi domain-containing protein n=1 Tax=Caerostris extrusa TaxID=172846 RepID=A0AAV4NHI6_CAEEX|nr:uncharacterized protein CEXT_498131 [Caerostris extrusa]